MVGIHINDCLSCGLCECACTNGALKLKYNEKDGIYRPHVDEDKCTHCGVCEKYCIADSYSNDRIEGEKIIGDYRRIALLSATDKKVRKGATSGGVVNRLIKYLIDNCVIEAALMVCQKDGAKTDTGYIVITNENVYMLDKYPRKFASRYNMVPVLVGLKKLETYSKVAVVGTPCQIFGVLKYEQLKKKEIIKIGIACSQGISYKATEQMLKKRQADNNKVYYRGEGWPGKNTIISSNQYSSEDHLQSLFNLYYSSQIFRNEACNTCSDQMNVYADISFFDYWNEKEIKKEHIGKSGVIIRSERIENYILDMVEHGELIYHGNISPKEVIESQSWAIKLKTNEKSHGVKLYLRIVEMEKKIGVYRIYSKKIFQIHSKIFHYLLNKSK